MTVVALLPTGSETTSTSWPDASESADAFTMGVGTILDARNVLMLVTGREKAEILAAAVEGPVTSMISATALQLHPRAVVVADEEAGALLKGREYYDWIFQNEPKWAAYRNI